MAVKPGDTVIYHKARALVVRVSEVVTPSGGKIDAVLIDRPRKGLVWVPRVTLEPVSRPKPVEHPGFVLKP